jgi:hypothetical protein
VPLGAEPAGVRYWETLAALNLRSLNKPDVAWALGGLLGVVVLTGVVVSLFYRLLSIDLPNAITAPRGGGSPPAPPASPPRTSASRFQLANIQNA